MSWIDSLLGIAAPVVGGLLGGPAGAIAGSAVGGAIASNSAAKTQANSADQATALQRQMWEAQQAQQKPFYDAGVTAENRMLDLLGLSANSGAAGYGSLNKPFTYSDLYSDPSYSFRFDQGMKALDRTAAARGGLISGGALKAATRYGQDAASTEYQNAFNRYQVQRANILNPLQSLTGAGQTSANTLGADAGAFGTNAGNNMIGAGNARASGYVGGANAITGGVGQYLNNQNQMALLNAFTNRGGMGGVSNIPAGYGGSPTDPWYG